MTGNLAASGIEQAYRQLTSYLRWSLLAVQPSLPFAVKSAPQEDQAADDGAAPVSTFSLRTLQPPFARALLDSSAAQAGLSEPGWEA